MDVIITAKNRPRATTRKPDGKVAGGTESTGDEDLAASTDVKPDGKKAPTVDDFMTRVRKLVPAEVAAAYTLLVTIAAEADGATSKYALPTALFIGTVVTVLALRQAGRSHSPPIAPLTRQYVITLLAFWAWGCCIRDPLEGFGYHIPTWMLLFGIVTVPTLGAYATATDGVRRNDEEAA